MLASSPATQEGRPCHISRVEETRRALLLIADIGGYTEYMQFHRTLLGHAEAATRRLLEKVVDAARDFDLIEIEGDAAFLSREADTLRWRRRARRRHRGRGRHAPGLPRGAAAGRAQPVPVRQLHPDERPEAEVRRARRRGRNPEDQTTAKAHRHGRDLRPSPAQEPCAGCPSTSFSPRISTGAAARLRPTTWCTRSRRTSRESDPCAPTSWRSRTSPGPSLRCRIPSWPRRVGETVAILGRGLRYKLRLRRPPRTAPAD